MPLPARYALALVATIVLETAIARVLVPRAWPRLRVDVPLLNLLTHPLFTWAAWSAGLEHRRQHRDAQRDLP